MFYFSNNLLKLIKIILIVLNMLVTAMVIKTVTIMTMIYNYYYTDTRLSDNQIYNNCIIELT